MLNAGATPIDSNKSTLTNINPDILQGLDDEFGVFVASLYYPESFTANKIGTHETRIRLAELSASLQVDEDESLPIPQITPKILIDFLPSWRSVHIKQSWLMIR